MTSQEVFVDEFVAGKTCVGDDVPGRCVFLLCESIGKPKERKMVTK